MYSKAYILRYEVNYQVAGRLIKLDGQGMLGTRMHAQSRQGLAKISTWSILTRLGKTPSFDMAINDDVVDRGSF